MKEVVSVILAAFLILVPLSVGPVKDLEKSNWFASNDRKGVEETSRLSLGGILTFVLNAGTLGVLIVQAFLYNSQRRLMSGQLEAAKTAADAAKLSADAGLWVHMPAFRIKVGIKDGLYNSVSTELYVDVRNAGSTSAIIVSTAVDVSIRQPPRVLASTGRPRMRFAGISRSTDVDLTEGKEHTLSTATGMSSETRNRICKATMAAWIFGYIEYIDFIGCVCRVGFCFASKPPDPSRNERAIRWVRYGDGTYNYHERNSPTTTGHGSTS